jgi:hypothetical protein
MHSFVLPLGVSGLVTADLDLRMFRNLAAIPATGVSLVAQATPGDYRLTGLPDPGPNRMAVTWTAAGVDGLYEWPTRTGSPSGIIIPSRLPGLTAAGIGLRVYVDGSPSGATLTLTPLSGGSGYVASGWPVVAQGRRWVLVYEIGGMLSSREWKEAPATGASVLVGIENWALQYYSASPLVLDGTNFTPDDPPSGWPKGGPFIELRASNLSSVQKTTSGTNTLALEKWAIYGRASTKEGTGAAKGFALAAELGRIYRGIQVAEVLWETPAVRSMGDMPNDGGVWNQAEVTIYGQRLARS